MSRRSVAPSETKSTAIVTNAGRGGKFVPKPASTTPGIARNALEQAGDKRLSSAPAEEHRVREHELRLEHSLGPNPVVFIPQDGYRAREQSGSDQKHTRERNLRDDQGVTDTPAART